MKISIVTATYNRKTMLEEAIKNVLSQQDADFEHIIVDGVSSDGTLEMLKQYKHLSVISEPDNGVYDAMNKGIKAATGDIIILLNSDDFLEENALVNIRSFFEDNPNCDYACGGTRILLPQSEQENILNDPYFKELKPNNVTRGKMGFNAIVFKRDVFEKVGYLNDKHKIASDRDFILRLTNNPEITGGQLHDIVYVYLSHDESLTIGHNIAHKKFFLELLEIAHEGIESRSNGNPKLLKAYKNWMAWAMIRYIFAPNAENASSIASELKRTTKKDLLWPFRALLEIVDHIQMSRKENDVLEIVNSAQIAKAA